MVPWTWFRAHEWKLSGQAFSSCCWQTAPEAFQPPGLHWEAGIRSQEQSTSYQGQGGPGLVEAPGSKK